jgi:hypothetical protein
LTQINEPRGVSVYAFSMEATEPNERLAGASTRSTEMPTKFHVGDRVEDKETHKRGRVTFVYSELERKGEVIEVLFDGRDQAVDVSGDSVRKVSTRQS